MRTLEKPASSTHGHFRRWARAIWLVGTVLLMGGCVTVPPAGSLWSAVSNGAPRSPEARERYNLAVYDDVSNWVYRRYYDEHFNGIDWLAVSRRHRSEAAAVRSDKELYSKINSLLDELHDRHTHASSAEEVAAYYRHRGVLVGLRSEQLPDTAGHRLVTEVFPRSPAAEAGVQAGWILVSCDGRKPMDVLGVGRLHEGQTVRCEFLDLLGKPQLASIVARRMRIPPLLHSEVFPNGAVLLRFDTFDMRAARWVHAQLKKHFDAPAVLFDLRGNPGGHWFALSSITNELFPESVDLGRMNHRGQKSVWDHLLVFLPSTHYPGRVAVIVSDFTASAAEIFSQVIQDSHRGKVVGIKTAGAVLTSVFWPLRNGGRLQLSVYDYHSPSGRRLEGEGVDPDLQITPQPYDPRKTSDPTLDAAIHLILSPREP